MTVPPPPSAAPGPPIDADRDGDDLPDDLPDGVAPAPGTRHPGPGRGPALLVVALATAIVVVFGVASVFASGGNAPPALRSVTLPGGTSVRLEPGTTALRTAVVGGQPPSDILGSIAVPAGSLHLFTANEGRLTSHYDQTITFTSRLSASEVVSFFRTVLRHYGWRIAFTGPGNSQGITGTEVLGEKASADGYYWELGAIVSPTAPTGTTPFALVLYEVPQSD
ncbi:MAG: hypothetical protein M0029_06075 [Actinomycetota bacterium]|jgi:hypothetical protein|nr:hypothetical protein [Actinomycetota bacterium]